MLGLLERRRPDRPLRSRNVASGATARHCRPVTGPPPILEHEKAVLGAAIRSPSAYDDALTAGLTADDFWLPGHGHIWTAVGEVVATGARPDDLLVANRMADHGLLASVGGHQAILALTACAAGLLNSAYHARLVINAGRLRRVQGAAAEIVNRLQQPTDDTPALIGWAEATMQAAAEGTAATRSHDAEEMMAGWASGYDTVHRAGVPTPWGYLNDLCGGLRPGLIVVFALPGCGKSAWGVNVAAHAASRETPTLLCSLEMSAAEISDRLIAHRTGLDHTPIRDRTLGRLDVARAMTAADEIGRWPLHVHDDPGLTVARIASAARRIPGLGLIVVDYAQLVAPDDPTRRAENRQTEIAAVSQALTRLHRRLGVPLVALAQSRRPSDSGAGRVPQMADIRESGQLGNDAHVVIGLHRTAEEPDIMEMHLLKQRNGPSGRTVRASWRGASFQIGNLDYQPDRRDRL